MSHKKYAQSYKYEDVPCDTVFYAVVNFYSYRWPMQDAKLFKTVADAESYCEYLIDRYSKDGTNFKEYTILKAIKKVRPLHRPIETVVLTLECEPHEN